LFTFMTEINSFITALISLGMFLFLSLSMIGVLNHRAVTLNHEVWLMLLGTNIVFWSDVHMNKILGDHGHIIA
jgi:hypothetical protein